MKYFLVKPSYGLECCGIHTFVCKKLKGKPMGDLLVTILREPMGNQEGKWKLTRWENRPWGKKCWLNLELELDGWVCLMTRLIHIALVIKSMNKSLVPIPWRLMSKNGVNRSTLVLVSPTYNIKQRNKSPLDIHEDHYFY